MKKLFLTLLAAYFSSAAQAPLFIYSGDIKANNETIQLPHACPCVYDWNGDGKKDLLLGHYPKNKPGAINYYENSGTNNAPILKAPVPMKANGVDISVTSG